MYSEYIHGKQQDCMSNHNSKRDHELSHLHIAILLLLLSRSDLLHERLSTQWKGQCTELYTHTCTCTVVHVCVHVHVVLNIWSCVTVYMKLLNLHYTHCSIFMTTGRYTFTNFSFFLLVMLMWKIAELFFSNIQKWLAF